MLFFAVAVAAATAAEHFRERKIDLCNSTRNM